MNFRLFILISLYSLPCLYTQIQNTESNTELPDPVLPDIDPVISKKKEEYSKFQELIIEFDQSMENMIPDDIISFTLSQVIFF